VAAAEPTKSRGGTYAAAIQLLRSPA
jgi:hypothetical protein